MKFIVLAIIYTSILGFAQSNDSTINSLYSKENILKFADYLFCEEDFLRAAEEYQKIDEKFRDDKINFKIALSFSIIGEYSKSETIFNRINSNSPLYQQSRLELLKILFLQERFDELRTLNKNEDGEGDVSIQLPIKKLLYFSFLKDQQVPEDFDTFTQPFNDNEKHEIGLLYTLRQNLSIKNPLLSSILSALVPGAGKMYVGEFSDGLFALLSVGLFSFLAYDNFNAGHNFRGWLFTGIAAGFYGGNVYGSYSAAQIHNAQIRYEYNLRLDSFIKSKNYFIPKYDFCE
ncbi:MAG: hypothetical protein HXY50_14915 [Ignavibacteriaceae bacterium]|nr:hypothetical protein [Ignavibacteriaceae bacterium]